jgi:hypothetical protein
MWLRLRQMTGALWLALGITMLAMDVLELKHSEFFFGWSYYLVGWSYFLLCVMGGVLLFGAAPLGRRLVTLLAVLLGLYALALWAEAEGAPLWAQLWFASLVGFAIWSLYLVQRRNA